MPSSALAHAVPLPLESGVELSPPRARAKAVARPERIVSARVFSSACDACGLSNEAIARKLGVDERRVREYRSGEKSPRLEQLFIVQATIEMGVGVALVEHAKTRALGVSR